METLLTTALIILTINLTLSMLWALWVWNSSYFNYELDGHLYIFMTVTSTIALGMLAIYYF